MSASTQHPSLPPAAPRLLEEVLLERFRALPRRRKNFLCDQPTLGHALVAMMRDLCAVEAVVHTLRIENDATPDVPSLLLTVGFYLDAIPAWEGGHIKGRDLYRMPEQSGFIATLQGAVLSSHPWIEGAPPPARHNRTVIRNNRHRRHRRQSTLTYFLSAALVTGKTVDGLIRDESPLAPWGHGIAVPLWCHARLAEGHTPESARIMLGLTLAPGAAANIDLSACFPSAPHGPSQPSSQ